MSAVAIIVITCDGCGAQAVYAPQKGQVGISTTRLYFQLRGWTVAGGRGGRLPASRRDGKDWCPSCTANQREEVIR